MLAAEQTDAFGNAREAQAADDLRSCGLFEAATVVKDFDAQFGNALFEFYVRGGGATVFENVIQAFLDNAIDVNFRVFGQTLRDIVDVRLEFDIGSSGDA